MRKTIIDDELKNRNAYCRKIGNIMFVMIYIKLDVCFAMLKFNQYMSNSNAHHDITIKQFLNILNQLHFIK